MKSLKRQRKILTTSNNQLKDPLKTASYDYQLPDNLIATYPVQPADSAKLLVYHRATKQITHTNFTHLLDFIPIKTEIFFNDTKVIKARIFGQKSTGGQVELLLNKPLANNTYLVFIRGKVKVGTILQFDSNLVVEVIALQDDGSRIVKFFLHNQTLDFLSLVEILNTIGHLPLPPYLKREDEKDDEKTYQTLFAKKYGAVAAPTASLHFTPQLLENLKRNYHTNYLTLHVGAGTFKPVEVENILDHPMHSEYFEIPKESCSVLDSHKKILAIGTTVTRTIEFYNKTKQTFGEANIFLNPLNTPKRVDYLLTNFHLPKSTLIMLVASFIGLEETLNLYNVAVKNNYRFFSYGDGMLII
ncbi:MAG: tRNA preQ1(34) S-adenosylmethionine ribosyltransferase-isomerase QueA [Campylobacterales bacterium]|nr:tRNA preQ1(34) S-adenosylmethionine ribosyltransferase-isomerase QueA [Campylobacterales bacterium]